MTAVVNVNMDSIDDVRELLKSKFSQGLRPKDFFMKWSLGASAIKLPQFNAGLRSLGITPSAGSQQLFKSFDSDSSGGVSLEELSRHLMEGPMTTRSAALTGGTAMTGTIPSQSTLKLNSPMKERTPGPGATPSAPVNRPPIQGFPGTPPQRRSPNGSGGYPGGQNAGSPSGFSPLSSPGATQQLGATQKPRAPVSPMGKPQVTPLHQRKETHTIDIGHHIVDGFKQIILHRAGAGGIAQLGRTFRIMDRDHNDMMTAQELKIGLQKFGMKVEDKDADLLLKAIDRDGNGKITYGEFLVALRGFMSNRRLQMVDMAFQIMDKTGDGVITIADLQCYNAKFDPDVQSGKISYAEALGHLLHNFDGLDQDGTVTKDEFIEYYRNISASIDNDDYFELMMRNAWHIPGGEGWCANTSNARVCITLAGGEQKVVCIENDLGLDIHNKTAVMRALAKQGVKNVVDYHTCD